MRYAIIIEKPEARAITARMRRTCRAASRRGATVEEVTRLMSEGIEFHIQGLREGGLPVPAPTTFVDYAEVAA